MKKKVILTCPDLGDREFDADHAARILAMPNNGGWKLKEEPKQVDAGPDDDTQKAGKSKKGK